MAVYAFPCPHCRYPIPLPLGLGRGGTVVLHDNLAQCPSCRQSARMPNGVFRIFDDVLVATRGAGRDDIEALTNLIRATVQREIAPHEAVARAAEIRPAFGPLVDQGLVFNVLNLLLQAIVVYLTLLAMHSGDVSAEQLHNDLRQTHADNVEIMRELRRVVADPSPPPAPQTQARPPRPTAARPPPPTNRLQRRAAAAKARRRPPAD